MKPDSSFYLFCALFFVCTICSSCAVVPYYFPHYSGRGLIDTSEIKPGKTTKEEVLLRFGAAFSSSRDETLFTAQYYVKRGHYGIYWGIGAYGEVKDHEVGTHYKVEIEFDENDVVNRCEEFKNGYTN